MKNIIIKIGDLICILIIIVLVIFEVMKFTHYIYVLQVKTGSMEENIHVGDYIIVKKQDEYKVGDVVTFTYQNHYITHRIAKIENNKITTKGDANNTYDEPINKNEIIGKYIFKNSILNYVIHYRIVISILAIIIFGITCIPNKNPKNIKEKEEII